MATGFGLCRPSSGQNIYKNLNGGVYSVLFVNVMGSHLQSNKGKGKAIPLQAWTGPKGSRRLILPDFKTIGT